MKKLLFLFRVFIMIISPLLLQCLFAQGEQLIITTYYPSPSGSYNELGVDKLAVNVSGDSYIGAAQRQVAVQAEFTAMRVGDAHIGWSMIIGSGGNADGSNSDFAYDQLIGTPDRRPGDGELLVKNRIGIGATQPVSTLHIRLDQGSGLETVPYPMISFENPNIANGGSGVTRSGAIGVGTNMLQMQSRTGIQFVTNESSISSLPFSTPGAGIKMTINQAGNVGIGLGAPQIYGTAPNNHQTRLDVNGYAAANDVWLKDVGRWASEGGGVLDTSINQQVVNGDTGVIYCPAAHPKIVSGGWYGMRFDNIDCNRPISDVNGQGWQVCNMGAGAGEQWTIYAVCAR